MRARPLLVPSLIALPLVACQAAHRSSDSSTPGTANSDPAISDPATSDPAASNERAEAGFQGETTRGLAAAALTAPSNAPGAAVPVAATKSASEPVLVGSAAASLWQEDFLQNEQARQELVRDRARKLAAKYVESAQAHLDRADLDAALADFATALDVDPASETARAGFLQTKALMGDEDVLASSLLEDELAYQSVRRAEARIAANEAIQLGDAARRDGDFEEAISQYRRADVILALHPLIEDSDLDRQVVERKIEGAKEQRDAAVARAETDAAAAAAEAKARAEAESANYRFNRLREIYDQANNDFAAERYADAEDKAEQILRLDPGNEQAVKMRDIAQQARFYKQDEEIRRQHREEWQRTMAELEQEAVPQTESLIFEDLDRWREVKDRQAYEFDRAGGPADAERARILDVLDSTQVPARFGNDGDGTELSVVRDYLQQVTGVNFLISPDAADLDATVDLDLGSRSVRSILDFVDRTNEELTWKVADGTVQFVTPDEATGELTLQIYEVRDLVRPPKDFQAPPINVLPSEGIEYPEEDPREPEATVLTGDDLASLISDNIAPDSWDDASINATETGTLVVYQTREVHDEISALLEELREAAGLMVQIQTRFLKVADNFLEDIGIDFRGLGSPGLGDNNFFNDFGAPGGLNNEIGQDTDVGAFYDDDDNGDIKGRVENLFDTDLGGELDNAGGLSFQWTYLNDLQLEMVLRAVSKSERIELVTAPNILVFNTARSNLQVLNQLAYVQDYNVEIATGAAIADPIVQVVQDGVVLDVRPVISADRRFITLDLRPTVATLTRPIAEVATSLATSGTVTIQLPELELQRMRTVVSVPDGGTVLLGGLKLYEEQNLRSGVPILNKIPIVSFFFDRKGTYVSKQKTLILLRASIVIDDELAPTDGELGLIE